MNVFLARQEHLPEIARLERENFHEPWSESALELFVKDGAFCALCLDGERGISYCTVLTVLDEAQIVNVATDEGFRGAGYARNVLTFVLEECRRRKINSVSLEVRESNEAAIALYVSLGFNAEGKRKDFYKNPRENALVMIKNLE